MDQFLTPQEEEEGEIEEKNKQQEDERSELQCSLSNAAELYSWAKAIVSFFQ